METFIFLEGISHINARALSNTLTFEEQVVNSPLWRKGTNIAKSLEELEVGSKTYFHASTVLIIVSDAKTVESSATVEKLKSVKAKLRNILWFNPIPERNGQVLKILNILKSTAKYMIAVLWINYRGHLET